MTEFMTGEIPLNFKHNPYKRVVWEDDLEDPNTGEVLEEGTIFWAEYGNNLEWGIYNSYRFMLELARQMQRIQVQLELDGRAPNNAGSFADTLDGGTNKIALDKAQTDVVEAVAVGTTVLKVANTTGFSAFKQVTVYDDINSEDVLITEINADAKTITVQALANAYKKGAKVACSNVAIDTTLAEMGIGDWQTYSVVLVEVV
ncbi:hypothetical protein [Bacillus ndiopicus]|uniref:hypothetical protein n=1 Tax=Bacillus ndiopicus TaxID=1347368 RepID=UPI0005A888F3|nr:hypothetical protein [Bacillus ndiopicus]